MNLTSRDPKGPGRLALRIAENSPPNIYVQQNQGRRIRISANSNRSGKTIWVSEHDYGIELSINGGNIKRYGPLIRSVLGRERDSDYDNGKNEYHNWKDVSDSSILEIVRSMNNVD
jgi:hypothetical protein